MSHLVRLQPDSKWAIGFLVPGLTLAGIDQNTFVAVNGDLGGTWLPLVQVTIAGAGVVVAGPWTFGGQQNGVTGEVTFDQGTDDDFFQYDVGHPSRAQSGLQNMCEVYSELPEQARVEVTSTIALGTTINGNGVVRAGAHGARFQVPLRVHNRGRLLQTQFLWRVGESHAFVPQFLPRFRVVAVDAEGNVFPLRAPDALTDEDGFISVPTPASGAAYFAGGTVQSIAYGCNQNNVIDVGAFAYFAEMIEEDGTGTWVSFPNYYTAMNNFFDSITLLDSRA